MYNYQNLMKNLFSIDKSSYPYKEIKQLLRCLEDLNFLIHSLHNNYYLIRIRRNYCGQSFKTISELSYKPKESNSEYCRASTPFNTMFYCTSCERRDKQYNSITDFEYGLKIALFETFNELRNNYKYGFGKYNPLEVQPYFKIRNNQKFKNIEFTYSIWEVNQEINLVKICMDELYDYDNIEHIFRQRIWLSHIPIDKLSSIDLFKYLSFEFSKKDRFIKKHDYNYMVSAIASETLSEIGFDGLSYPSSRNDGLGINFAIKPSIVDNNLSCVEVGLINVSNINESLIIEYLDKQKLKIGQSHFDLKCK